jgi:uncharacterized circularly permuted ATP-grasp superfamily protein
VDETARPGDAPTTGLVAGYDAGGFFDEMVDADGRPRPHYRALYERLAALTDDGLDERIRTANAFFLLRGSASRSTATKRAPTASFRST